MMLRAVILVISLLSIACGCDYVARVWDPGSFKETWDEPAIGPFGLEAQVCEGPDDRTCLTAAAKLTRDSSYCARLGDTDRGSCFRQLASSTGNPDHCLEMKASDVCLTELARQTGRHDVCDRAPEASAVACVEALAAATQDPAVCEKTKQKVARDHCWIIVARAREEQALCRSIENSELRARCNAQFVTLTLDAVGTCELSDLNLADACFAEAALTNPMHCARVRADSRRRECYTRAALDGLGQPGACAQLPPAQMVECFVQFATHRRVPATCDEIEDAQNRDICRVQVAKALGHAESCLVVSQPFRAPCARAIYGNARDPRLCQVLHGRDRDECVKAL